MYTTTYKDLVDIHEDSAAEDLSDTVDLVLTDPPYTTRRTGNRAQSNHDKLSETDMAEVADLCDKSLPEAVMVSFSARTCSSTNATET